MKERAVGILWFQPKKLTMEMAQLGWAKLGTGNQELGFRQVKNEQAVMHRSRFQVDIWVY